MSIQRSSSFPSTYWSSSPPLSKEETNRYTAFDPYLNASHHIFDPSLPLDYMYETDNHGYYDYQSVYQDIYDDLQQSTCNTNLGHKNQINNKNPEYIKI